MKVSLIIPTLNEIEGMREMMPRIKKDWVDEIIVVDGNSTDGTFEYAKECGCITLKQKSKGAIEAYWEALELATGDVIVTFSPDGNSVPERIPELIAKMHEGYDMAIASRYCQGAKSYDDDLASAFANWFFTAVINLLFGGCYTDTLVILRAWRRELIGLFCHDVAGAGFEPELCIQCARHKKKVAEIPGDEPKRIIGGGKVNKLKGGIAIFSLILKEFFLRGEAAGNPSRLALEVKVKSRISE